MRQAKNKKLFVYAGLVTALIGSGAISHVSSNDTAQATTSAVSSQETQDRLVVDLATVSTSQQYQVPVLAAELPLPQVSTRAYAVYDELTGVMLVEGADQTSRPIASLTKLMTAQVVLEKSSMDTTLVASHDYSDLPAARLGLRSGESYLVRDLLASLLINSHNDTAAFLADNLSGGKPAQFIAWMNDKARELGMTQTRFGNSIGLDDGQTYSTPRDLALLTRSILSSSEIADIVAQKEREITERSSGRSVHLASTNQMLGDTEYRVLGVKTGQTPAAGGCLITRAQIEGRMVIVVVLGSHDRFADTRHLLDWTSQSIDWR